MNTQNLSYLGAIVRDLLMQFDEEGVTWVTLDAGQSQRARFDLKTQLLESFGLANSMGVFFYLETDGNQGEHLVAKCDHMLVDDRISISPYLLTHPETLIHFINLNAFTAREAIDMGILIGDKL